MGAACGRVGRHALPRVPLDAHREVESQLIVGVAFATAPAE
jgi:hypothetical protein